MRTLRTLVATGVALTLMGVPLVVASAPAATRSVDDGSVIRTWTDLAISTVRSLSAGDAQAARLYAMVDVAMYDAVNGLVPAAQRRTAALVPAEPDARGSAAAAAATAAHDVLTALYPANGSLYDAQLATDLAAVQPAVQAEHGRQWGAHVAAEVVAARAADGSTPVTSQAGSSEVGKFPNSWSGTQFANLRPFAIQDPQRYVSSGPPPLDSAEYAAAFNDVKAVGDASLNVPGAQSTFQFWKLAGGTEQPPGAWLRITSTIAASTDLSLADTARLFALESMALVDTVAPTYTTKVVYHSWRPQTAIARADEDGNPNTNATPYTWVARGGSAGSPEHFSGHSSFSAAGATVLIGFFCTDDITFTLATGSSNGQTRTYSSIWAAAQEAGRSRVLGGLHFEFSNQAGLESGRQVAQEVLATALRAEHPNATNADCGG